LEAPTAAAAAAGAAVGVVVEMMLVTVAAAHPDLLGCLPAPLAMQALPLTLLMLHLLMPCVMPGDLHALHVSCAVIP
jgi:hypothetical protein